LPRLLSSSTVACCLPPLPSCHSQHLHLPFHHKPLAFFLARVQPLIVSSTSMWRVSVLTAQRLPIALTLPPIVQKRCVHFAGTFRMAGDNIVFGVALARAPPERGGTHASIISNLTLIVSGRGAEGRRSLTAPLTIQEQPGILPLSWRCQTRQQ